MKLSGVWSLQRIIKEHKMVLKNGTAASRAQVNKCDSVSSAKNERPPICLYIFSDAETPVRSCHELLLIVGVIVFIQLVIASALLGNLLTRYDCIQDGKNTMLWLSGREEYSL